MNTAPPGPDDAAAALRGDQIAEAAARGLARALAARQLSAEQAFSVSGGIARDPLPPDPSGDPQPPPTRTGVVVSPPPQNTWSPI